MVFTSDNVSDILSFLPAADKIAAAGINSVFMNHVLNDRYLCELHDLAQKHGIEPEDIDDLVSLADPAYAQFLIGLYFTAAASENHTLIMAKAYGKIVDVVALKSVPGHLKLTALDRQPQYFDVLSPTTTDLLDFINTNQCAPGDTVIRSMLERVRESEVVECHILGLVSKVDMGVALRHLPSISESGQRLWPHIVRGY